MTFSLSFAGVQITLLPSVSSVSSTSTANFLSSVRHKDGRIIADLSNFTGKIVISEDAVSLNEQVRVGAVKKRQKRKTPPDDCVQDKPLSKRKKGASQSRDSDNEECCCGGVISINSSDPIRAASTKMSLNVYGKYASVNPTADYVCKKIGGTPQYNLFSIYCSNKGISRTNKKHPGARCNNCQSLWEKRSSKLKQMLARRCKNTMNVERILSEPILSATDADAMKKWTKTNRKELSEAGLMLREKALTQLELYRIENAAMSEQEEMSEQGGMI